jgi:hypothetical protein
MAAGGWRMAYCTVWRIAGFTYFSDVPACHSLTRKTFIVFQSMELLASSTAELNNRLVIV